MGNDGVSGTGTLSEVRCERCRGGDSCCSRKGLSVGQASPAVPDASHEGGCAHHSRSWKGQHDELSGYASSAFYDAGLQRRLSLAKAGEQIHQTQHDRFTGFGYGTVGVTGGRFVQVRDQIGRRQRGKTVVAVGLNPVCEPGRRQPRRF